MNASMSALSGDRDIVKAEHVSDRYATTYIPSYDVGVIHTLESLPHYTLLHTILMPQHSFSISHRITYPVMTGILTPLEEKPSSCSKKYATLCLSNSTLKVQERRYAIIMLLRVQERRVDITVLYDALITLHSDCCDYQSFHGSLKLAGVSVE